jgi:hypothetical protein
MAQHRNINMSMTLRRLKNALRMAEQDARCTYGRGRLSEDMVVNITMTELQVGVASNLRMSIDYRPRDGAREHTDDCQN